jgi:acetylornithine deacetylase/succinyl-diaminopimelate desuccinylase-like protein
MIMSLSNLNDLQKDFAASKEEILKSFYTFLKFQSVSSEPEFKPQILACVDWLQTYLKDLGFHVEIWPTKGHPTIFASYQKAGPNQPTLLIYNHYDVQPVDPLELWLSPPFEPTLRDGEIYARGAQDNKGQCFYVLLALKKLIERNGTLPINIKLCIEGEEECGSAGLSEILEEKKESLKADYLAIVDLGMSAPNKPAVTLGTRGIVTMDVVITGTHIDLHSGFHGGMVFNPLHALVQALATVRDESGKITIPHFYDDVTPLNKEEKRHLSSHFDAQQYQEEFGAKPTGGEREYSPLERGRTRPTLEINGISGGYAGEGFKTVIPSKAIAKISCRLVPNQDPKKIGRLVANFLESKAPIGTTIQVHIHEGYGKAVRANIDSQAVKAFAKAYEEVFSTVCEYLYAGGSIPIVPALEEACGGETVLLGLGLPGDCIHAPNEHFGLKRIEQGFLVMVRAIELLMI